LHHSSCITHLLQHQPVVDCINHTSLSFCMRTEQILWDSMRVGKATSFIVIVSSIAWRCLPFAHDLRSGTEFKSFVLWIIFNHSLVLVKSS
jgi:hypothetical protein